MRYADWQHSSASKTFKVGSNSCYDENDVNSMLEFFRRHTPVVLLAVWIAVSCTWEVPWQPVSPSDKAETMHEVLLLSDGLEKPRSVAYDAVLLDSGGWPRPELLLYFPKDSLRYKAGDVVIAIAKLEEGRGFVRSG